MKKSSKTMLGWNDYDKIRDPAGNVDIELYAFDRVEAYKEPQDIQDMFDKYGVETSVLMMNREYLIRHNKYALEIVRSRAVTLLRRVQS